MYCINWGKKALKQLLRFPEVDRIHVLDAVSKLEAFPAAQNVKSLSQHQYGYRLRVGRYRVLFDVETAVRIIDIQEVKRRDGNTY